MNNLEQMKKRKQNLSIVIAILIVLNLLLILVFATTTGNQDAGIATYSGEEVENPEDPIIFDGQIEKADVKTGANFTVALDSTGRVWAWGQNNKGQLGNGTLEDSVTKQPVLIAKMGKDKYGNETVIDENQLTNVKQIAVGEYHAAALTDNNEVYVWGYNYFGQTGNDSIRKELYAQKVSGLEGKQVKQIVTGANFTLALTTSGELFGLGDSANGQLGYYNTLRFTSIINLEDNKAEKELSNIKEISAGYKHIVALKNDGTVWNWGDTTGSGFDFTAINQVAFPEGETIKEIQAGNDVSMALSASGKVYTWVLGGNPQEVVLPTKTVLVEGTEGEETEEVQVQVKDKNGISIVNKTYYIIDTDGDVFGWGQNNVGQIGNYNTAAQTIPQKLRFEDENREEKINHKIDKLASSPVAGVNVNGAVNYDTAYAINASGYVLGWGYAGIDITATNYTDGSNTGKLLGDGDRTRADYIGSISVKAITGNDIEIKVGNTKDLLEMLKTEGYITGGRVNLYKEGLEGKVGEALTIRSINENIASYNKDTGIVTGITVGTTAAEVKTAKNTIYINIKVVDDNDVAFPKIETRNGYTVALKADGTVWAWGYNRLLGIEDTEHTNHSGIIVPTQVKGLENVKDIAIGNNFVLVLKTDGKIYAWGQNDLGQLRMRNNYKYRNS